MSRRLLALVVAMLLVTTALGPVATPAVAAPSGMVTIADAQISSDLPAPATQNLDVSVDDLEGAVYVAPEYADTTEVVLTTPGRARAMMDVEKVLGDGAVAIVIRDDADDRGRTVAIETPVLEQAVGRTPDLVRGTHSSGETWRQPVTYRDGTARIQFDHFSSNTVTFSGEVNVTGQFADGSTTAYNISALDAATDPQVTFTGAIGTETDTAGLNVVTGASSSVAGDEPASQVSVDVAFNDGSVYTKDYSNGVQPTEVLEIGVGGSETLSLDVESNQMTGLNTVTVHYGNGQADDVNVTVQDDEGEVTMVAKTNLDDSGSFTIDATDEHLNGTVDIIIAVPSSSSESFYLDKLDLDRRIPTDATVTVDGTTKTATGDTTLSFPNVTDGTVDAGIETGANDGGFVSGTVSYQEGTHTRDPSIGVNGNQIGSYAGTLSPGATASYSGSTSMLQNGENTVNVSLGAAPSGDAPAPVVDVNYTHEASDQQSVEYTARKFTEEYNVSKTFADANQNVELTIPHASTVVAVESVETRTNGGSWQSTSDYTLTQDTLTVQLGDFASGDTVGVRTEARKVAVTGGSITVTDPTPTGERLDTQIRIDSWSDGARIGLGAAPDGRRIHYTYNEDAGGQEYTRIHADGAQQLYLPATSAGAEMRVSTIPVEVNAKSGEVDLTVREPSTTEPQFGVEAGPTAGDTIEYTFVDASDGQSYTLYSTSAGVVRDSGTASSPLTLTDDDSDETLQFQAESSSSDDGGSGSVIGGPIRSTGGPLDSTPVVLLAWVGALVLLYVVDRGGGLRVPNPVPAVVPVVGGDAVSVPLPGSRGPLFWVGSTGATLLALEFISGGLISRTVFRSVTQLTGGLSDVVPLAGIIATILAAYYLYQRFIVGQQPRDIVIRSDGGDDR